MQVLWVIISKNHNHNKLGRVLSSFMSSRLVRDDNFGFNNWNLTVQTDCHHWGLFTKRS